MMTDKEIVEKLIARDNKATYEFFFTRCRPLFVSIIRSVFSYPVDFDEFVNEFYLHLMENDACRLRQFQGRSSIYQWMKVVAIRFFIARRDNMIDETSKETLLESAAGGESVDSETKTASRMDMQTLLERMPNRRYAYVIKRLILDDAQPKTVAEELRTNVDNLYNIKKRAVAALTEIALEDVENYGKASK